MFKKSILLLIILYFNHSVWSQDSNSLEYKTVIAELIESKKVSRTGLALTFKVKKVLSGQTNDSILVANMTYSDGGNQILSKIYPNYDTYCERADCNFKEQQDVVIKYSYLKSEFNTYCIIKWVAEKDRRHTFENLETYLKKKIKGNNIRRYNLLEEQDGKLLLKNKRGKIRKMAIQVGETWFITKIKKTIDY